MKSIKFLLVACLLGMAVTASAQFTNSGATTTEATDVTGWSGLRLSYNPITIENDKIGGIDEEMTGFSLGFMKSTSISKTTPLFFESGVAVTYATWDDDDDAENVESNITWWSASIPANLGYKFKVDESISLFPYLGLTLRYNILAEYLIETTDRYGDIEETKLDLFDKKDMGGKDNTWNRLQIGWQIGIRAQFNKFLIGASYGKDFNEIVKKGTVSVTSLSVGVNF